METRYFKFQATLHSNLSNTHCCQKLLQNEMTLALDQNKERLLSSKNMKLDPKEAKLLAPDKTCSSHIDSKRINPLHRKKSILILPTRLDNGQHVNACLFVVLASVVCSKLVQ